MAFAGEHGALRDVLRSAACDADLKEAMAEVMIFTTEVVGPDGAREQLRREQNGFGLRFGAAGGFLTPNMADVRSPVMVVLHGGRAEGRFEVNMFFECPSMPSARELLQHAADDPVAQSGYFIISLHRLATEILFKIILIICSLISYLLFDQ